MRMEYPGTSDQDEQKIRNRLQQRMARFREKFSMVSWRDTAGENNAIRDRVLSRLTPAQFAARGGLGSTRGSTPGSRDSQGRIIPLPGRRARGSAAAGDTTAQVQQPQARTVLAGPSNDSTVDRGFTPVNSQVHRLSGSHGGSRTGQQNIQTNLGNLNRQHQTRSSILPEPLLNQRLEGDQNATMGAAQQHHPSTSYTDDAALLPYSEFASAVPPHEGILPIMDGQGASDAANPGMQADQASRVYVGNRTTQQAENPSYAGPSESMQVPDGPSTDEDYEDTESLGTDDKNDLSEEDSDEEPDAEMPLAEEDTRMEPLTPEVCYELKRYLEDDRARTLMCLDREISLDELLLGMQNNQAKLKQGIKRARGEASHDDEVEYLQSQRAKRPRRGQGAAGSSSQPRPESQNHIYSGFDNSQPGPSGAYHRQGPLASKSRHPATRPIGSAVERLHSDRRRRPAPKATTAQKDTSRYLRDPQSDPVIDNEWTVFGYHADSQQSPYLPQQADGLRRQGLYTDPGQPQRGPEPYQPQRDNGVETSSLHTTIGAPQPTQSLHSQRQPGSERFRSAQNPAIQDVTGDMPSYDQNGPTEGRNPHNPGSSAACVQLTRDGNGNIVPRRAYQHFEESTAQDDPFFSDELFEGMLNGHPDINHVGSMYTHAQQQEIDDYYHRLMTPHPRPESAPSAPQNPMPPPPPIQVAQVAGSATQPVEESDLALGDISDWDPAWSEFVNDHDAEPLLQAGHPDEYEEKSPPGSPGL